MGEVSSKAEANGGRWVTILNKPYEPEAHVILKFMPGVTPPSKRCWGTSGFIEGGGHGQVGFPKAPSTRAILLALKPGTRWISKRLA